MEKLYSLRESEKAILEFFNENKNLIIIFGGVGHGLGIKGKFDTFLKFLYDKKFDIIFIRDNVKFFVTGSIAKP